MPKINSKETEDLSKKLRKKKIAYCSVADCQNSKFNAKKNCSEEFQTKTKTHRLPENKQVRAKWFDFLKKYGIYNEKVSVSYILCDDHFDESCFSRDLRSELLYNNKPQLVLQIGSVPTIYLKKKKRKQSDDFQTQTIDDIFKEYADKTEDFVTLTYKNIHTKRNFCCIINCKSDTRTEKLYSIEKYKLLDKIPNNFVDNSRSKEYICIKHFDQKYLNEVKIFKKDADFKINLITDYDLDKDAIPTVFTKSSSHCPTVPTNCNDEIELEFDKLISTEKVKIFDLPLINENEAHDSDFKINLITDYDLDKDAIPTVFTKSSSHCPTVPTNCNDEIELEFDKLISTKTETEKVQIFDLPLINENEAHIIARKKICRICFSSSNEIIKTNNLGKYKKVKNDIKFEITDSGKLFEEALNLKVLDVPNCINVCTECKLLLESFINLKNKSIMSNKKFLEIFHNVDWIDIELEKLNAIENEMQKISHIKQLRQIDSIKSNNIEPIKIECSSDENITNEILNHKQKSAVLDSNTSISLLSSSNQKSIISESYNRKQLLINRKKISPKLKCPHCPKILTTTYHLKLHIDKIHSLNSIEIRTCKICNKTLRSARHLRLHMETVHSDINQFFCEYCGKGFKALRNLYIHKIVHSNIRKHVCPIAECGKNFKRASHLKQHVFYHEKSKSKTVGPGPTKDVCDICGKEICSNFMNRHKAAHTHQYLTIDTGESEPRYKCPNCEKNYKNVKHLRRHLSLFHNVKRMFSCPRYNCKFKCRTREKFDKHELKHSEKIEINVLNPEQERKLGNMEADILSVEKNNNSSVVSNVFEEITFEEVKVEIL